jgi:hypothetical protein
LERKLKSQSRKVVFSKDMESLEKENIAAPIKLFVKTRHIAQRNCFVDTKERFTSPKSFQLVNGFNKETQKEDNAALISSNTLIHSTRQLQRKLFWNANLLVQLFSKLLERIAPWEFLERTQREKDVVIGKKFAIIPLVTWRMSTVDGLDALKLKKSQENVKRKTMELFVATFKRLVAAINVKLLVHLVTWRRKLSKEFSLQKRKFTPLVNGNCSTRIWREECVALMKRLALEKLVLKRN